MSNAPSGGKLPTYRELERVDGTPCAWSVWGNGDVLGALNLLTPERAAAAASIVRTGEVFALNWSVAQPDPPLFHRERFENEISSNIISSDDHIKAFNTQGSSQWDGFRHIRHPIHGHFSGESAEGTLGVDHWAKRGIVGRGILADVGAHRESAGRPFDMTVCEPVAFSEVLETLDSQGTQIETGDILLIRIGWLGWYEGLAEAARNEIADMTKLSYPGLSPGESTVAGLWDAHVAAVACDNPSLEAWPPGSQLGGNSRDEWFKDPATIEESFAHTMLLPMLGIPIGEMFVLDALAQACAADGSYEFMFTSAPLNIPRGVASPPNALAIK